MAPDSLLTPPAGWAVGAFAANILRPAGSTWPMFPVLTNFLALFMLGGFVSAWYVRPGNRVVNATVGTILSLLFATVAVRAVQPVAFDGQSCWFLSILLLGFSSLMGAVNYLTTIVKLRCPGMTMFRLPLSVWSLFITSILVLLATGYHMLFAGFGGFGGAGIHVHVMHLVGWLMFLLFFHLYFAPWRRYRRAVAAGETEVAGRELATIRRVVGINLVLGLITVAVGASGRYWG